MFQSQVAIVTGGGQGIGREISLSLARAGATVVIADIADQAAEKTARDIQAETGGKTVVLHADVGDENSVIKTATAVRELFGAVHALINNSGVAGPMGPTESVTLEDWRQAAAVNVDGVFLMCKHFLPLLREAGQGCIVNISSVSAKRPLVERASYCATKAAVIGLTRTLALECGKWNIRVNTVCPGAVDGPRQRAILEHAAKAQNKSLAEITALKTAASPLGTFVPPSSVADVVTFLCSPAAAMMTGQDINVSAGAWMS